MWQSDSIRPGPASDRRPIDAEARFIAQYVAEEIDSPESQKAQVIDVAEQLDQTWTGI
jgi:hypothetical protein